MLTISRGLKGRLMLQALLAFAIGAMLNVLTVMVFALLHRSQPVLGETIVSETYTRGTLISIGFQERVGGTLALLVVANVSQEQFERNRQNMPLLQADDRVLHHVPSWSVAGEYIRVRRHPVVSENDFTAVIDSAIGFPWPCLRYQLRAHGNQTDIVTPDYEIEYGVSLPAAKGSWLGLPTAIPLLPMVIPFVSNTIIYTILFIGAATFVRKARGRGGSGSVAPSASL